MDLTVSVEKVNDLIEKISKRDDFVRLVYKSITGGGRTVTFSDDDILDMEEFLGIREEDSWTSK